MSGRHLFGKLTRGFSSGRRARVAARKAALREAMLLHKGSKTANENVMQNPTRKSVPPTSN